MKIILLILVSCLVLSNIFSQDRYVDSLKSELLRTKNEKKQIPLLVDISHHYCSHQDFDSLFYVVKKLQNLSIKYKDTISLIKGYKYHGVAEISLGNINNGEFLLKKAIDLSVLLGDTLLEAKLQIDAVYHKLDTDSSIKILKKGLQVFYSNNDTLGIMTSYLYLMEVYQIRGKFDSAANYAYKSLEYAKKINNLSYQANSHNRIATIIKKNNIEKAEYHILESIKIYNKLKDEYSAGYGYFSYADILRSKKNDSAIYYFEKSLETFIKYKNPIKEASAYQALGLCFYEKKEWNKSVFYCKKSISIFEDLNIKGGVIVNCNLLGALYDELNNKDKAIYYLEKGLKLAKENNLIIYQTDLYSNLVEFNVGKKDFKKAFKYQLEYNAIKDSLFNQEKIKSINELEIKYQTEKKESEIKELALKNELAEIKANLEKRKSKIYLFGGIGGVFILSLMGLLFYRQRKNRFEKAQYKLEQKLLRTQLNPHFMSNFLMVIQTSVHKDSPEIASKNVSKFGRLNRQVLEASRNDYVLLEDEIDFLKNYMDLHLVLTPDKFEYNIQVSSNIDESEISLPPMLVQPFIENAIEHAFVNQEEKGKINIKFNIEGNNLVINILDNGVGLNTSKIKTSDFKHNSHATNITKERVKLFKRKWNKSIMFNIDSLQKGTEVLFKIPLNVQCD